MRKYDKYIGKKIGSLTCLGFSRINEFGQCYYNFKCECGKEKEILIPNVLKGATTSCGCFHKEVMQKYNDYEIKGDYVEIKARTSGHVILVDLDDFDKVKNESWRVNCHGYAVSKISGRMHRLITNAPNGMVVDHINHNKLDNRKSNLMVCSQSVNGRNRERTPKYIFEQKHKNSDEATYYVQINYKRYKCSSLEEAKEKRNKLLKNYLQPFVYQRYMKEWENEECFSLC